MDSRGLLYYDDHDNYEEFESYPVTCCKSFLSFVIR